MTSDDKKQKIQIRFLLKMLYRSFGRYKFKLSLLFVLSFLNGLVEGVGVSALIPVFSFVVQHTMPNVGQDFISGIIGRILQTIGLEYTLKSLIILVGCLLIIKIFSLVLVNYLAARMVADYENDTRTKLFLTTFQAKWPCLLKEKIGHLDQLLTTHVHAASNFLLYLISSALTLAMFIVYVFIAVKISPSISVTAVIAGVMLFLFLKKLYQYNKIISTRTEMIYKQLAHHANESLIGIKTIKSFCVESAVIQKGSEQFSELKQLDIKAAIIRIFTSILMQPLGLVFAAGAFIFLYKTSAFNFAAFIVILYAINKIFTQLETGQMYLQCMISMAPYLTYINDYQAQMSEHGEQFTGGDAFSFKKEIAIQHLTFSFSPSKEILNDINFIIKKGEVVGLIGPSGVGKTTLVDILLRLFEPTRGKILLDGKEINSINLKEWRTKIGYIPQDAFLINDTIENNIKFYNDNISFNEIARAAQIAQMYDFIESLPDKFSTIVGERGVMLSGGQRQRIVLARVLARQPELLILDEATSALDNESELLVQKAIENLRGKVTTLIIAHRLTTVLPADKLIVLSGGRIIEQGVPRELVKQSNSYFSKLYNLKNQ